MVHHICMHTGIILYKKFTKYKKLGRKKRFVQVTPLMIKINAGLFNKKKIQTERCELNFEKMKKHIAQKQTQKLTTHNKQNKIINSLKKMKQNKKHENKKIR